MSNKLDEIITEKLFDENMERALDYVKHCWKNGTFDDDSDFQPHLIVVGADEKENKDIKDTEDVKLCQDVMCLINMPGEHKREIFEEVGRNYAMQGRYPLAVIFISQVWVSTVLEEDFPSMVPPSEDPDRKEAIIISGLSTSKTYHKTIIIDITTDDSGNKVVDFDNLSRTDVVDSPILYPFFIGCAKETLKQRDAQKKREKQENDSQSFGE